MKQTNTKSNHYQKACFNLGISAMVVVGLALAGFIVSLGAILQWFEMESEQLIIVATAGVAAVAAILFLVMGILSIVKVDHYGKIKGKTAGIVITCLAGAAPLSFGIGMFMPVAGKLELLIIGLGAVIGALLLANTIFTIILMVKNKKAAKAR